LPKLAVREPEAQIKAVHARANRMEKTGWRSWGYLAKETRDEKNCLMLIRAAGNYCLKNSRYF